MPASRAQRHCSAIQVKTEPPHNTEWTMPGTDAMQGGGVQSGGTTAGYTVSSKAEIKEQTHACEQQLATPEETNAGNKNAQRAGLAEKSAIPATSAVIPQSASVPRRVKKEEIAEDVIPVAALTSGQTAEHAVPAVRETIPANAPSEVDLFRGSIINGRLSAAHPTIRIVRPHATQDRHRDNHTSGTDMAREQHDQTSQQDSEGEQSDSPTVTTTPAGWYLERIQKRKMRRDVATDDEDDVPIVTCKPAGWYLTRLRHARSKRLASRPFKNRPNRPDCEARSRVSTAHLY